MSGRTKLLSLVCHGHAGIAILGSSDQTYDASSAVPTKGQRASMGVNHGGGETSPPEFGVGDANANCPPDFVMFQNFKHQIACITMQ